VSNNNNNNVFLSRHKVTSEAVKSYLYLIRTPVCHHWCPFCQLVSICPTVDINVSTSTSRRRRTDFFGWRLNTVAGAAASVQNQVRLGRPFPWTATSGRAGETPIHLHLATISRRTPESQSMIDGVTARQRPTPVVFGCTRASEQVGQR